MGADMLLSAIWTYKGQIDIENAVKVVRETALAETDPDMISALNSFAGGDYIEDELAIEVMLVSNDGTKEAWADEIAENYRTHFLQLEKTLNSREVVELHLGDLVGYVTGGMSWGDTPTDAMDVWGSLLFDSDPDYGNPYGDICYASLGFVTFGGSSQYGQPVATVTVEKQS